MRSFCLDNSLICRYLGHIQFVSTCERPDLDLTVSEFIGFFPEYIFNLQLQSVPSERNYNSQFGFSNTQCNSSLSALMAPIIWRSVSAPMAARQTGGHWQWLRPPSQFTLSVSRCFLTAPCWMTAHHMFSPNLTSCWFNQRCLETFLNMGKEAQTHTQTHWCMLWISVFSLSQHYLWDFVVELYTFKY